ncbi:TetR-like C-terminal domain-containing protein [Curtobacterium sp. NPDC089689]|uniref:TetR-like C-terminal domain-containing protein n=1 Tax=Curtobacterium sp. NPDC089689 TaxID=3363968 RepID=UPI003812B1E3
MAEAVLDGAWPVTAPVMGTTGSLREDLTAWWYTTAEASLRADTRPIVRALIAAVTEHPQALAAFDALLTHPTREVLQRRIAQAVRDGDCSADVDSTAFADLVIGDLTLLTLGSVELSRARVEQTVQIVLGPPESTS